jgi:hypothetical protein
MALHLVAPTTRKERMMRLVYKGTKREVQIGDEVLLRSGEKAIVTYFRQPSSSASEGKISVRGNGDAFDSEFYVSVVGAEWIEREDRIAEDALNKAMRK